MDLSIREAAALIGKSPRTVRAMAADGRLPARRVGGRWLITRDALLGAPGAHEAVARRKAEVERLRDHVGAALDEVTPDRRRFYSVRDVTAFEVMSTVRSELEAAQRDEPAHARALGALTDAMHRLTEGFHQFHVEAKVARFVQARDRCCAAIAELTHLGRVADAPDALGRAARLERDALGSLRGLLRRAERRAREAERAA